MSKITFRADDELIEQLEGFDASKSEVMREALRQFLEEPSGSDASTSTGLSDADGSLDELIAERVDTMIAERLNQSFTPQPTHQPQDINVNIALDGDDATSDTGGTAERKTSVDDGDSVSDSADDDRRPCQQCGEELSSSHVYCPNCGEKASRRVFCECGDELRSDWAFCPGCGRRTPAADVLDQP